MIIYITIIILFNYLLLHISHIENNKFTNLINIINKLKKNIPSIYFILLDKLLLQYNSLTYNTLDDIYILNDIYNNIINNINRIDIIYVSDEITYLKKQFIQLFTEYHKNNIIDYNNKITYNTLNYNNNIYNNIFL